MSRGRLPGRVALIAGGTRGIGRGLALDLARAGWAVAAGYRSNEAAAAETRAGLDATGAPALVLRADVGDAGAARGLVREVEAAWGRIDALVVCAGTYHRVDLLAETPEGWREAFDSNLHALFDLAQAAAPGMIARGWGRILGFSLASADRLAGHTRITAHYAAKVGVLVLVRSLARALAPHGITVNAISPGLVDSGGLPAGEVEALRPDIPAGRVGEVGDVVAAARFLLSEEAGYVTGTNVHVSGGWGV